jgi:23S rRNA (uracil1939-C5)-methyltransferase
LIGAALADRAVTAGRINKLVEARPGERRRAEFASRHDDALRLGFMSVDGGEIVDVRTCPVLLPELVAARDRMRATLSGALARRSQADIQVLASDAGVDLLVKARQAPSARARDALLAFARDANLARVSWRAGDGEAETIVLHRVPTLKFVGVDVEIPPGAFVQPTARGESAITAEVARHAAGAKRIVELYAGCGTLGFALAGIGPVRAFEGDERLCAAQTAAIRRAGLSGRIGVTRRDLARQPLLASDYARGEVVVLNPPRAGAREVCEQLARSRVESVVVVSCHPASLARDARILVDGGFDLIEVTPIDQFLWTPHLESVALFRRR